MAQILRSSGFNFPLITIHEEFGEEGIAASLERNWKRTPGELCSSILADVRAFMGEETPTDDQTLLVVKLDPVAIRTPIAGLTATVTR